MVWIVAVLGIVGAALPSWGVLRVYVRARAAESERRALVAARGGAVGATYNDVAALFALYHSPSDRLRVARLDVVLVVAGLFCTAAAAIVSATG